ncbi:ABC transporter permease [Actinomadura harenae]|uniref:ABC transporter permease n=1 Tax=Actinomadura harenae TaxID=2483351 RepID=A0A3M2LI09_9ACTN|nr:ABC transporter permease [Actinomadura harenae]RMI36420.1 ABC transporter permease [Actinomadura harenae]
MMRGAMASEWLKLRSVNSMRVTLPLACAASFVLAVAPFASDPARSAMSAAQLARYDAAGYCYSGGFLIVVLAVGVLGTLSATSEYGSGLIGTTFLAVPRRRAVLAAKAAVVGGAALLVGLVLSLATFLTAQRMLAGKHLAVGLGDPGAARAVAGAGAFLAVTALAGLAIGIVLRRATAATAAFLGLYVGANLVTGALGGAADAAGRWTPLQILKGLTSTRGASAALPGPTAAALECLAYLVVLLGLAALVIGRRDV